MEKQQELFTEFKEVGTVNKPFGKGLLPEKTFVFSFTYEKFILVILGFIIVLSVVFGFGFERGRRRAQPIIANKQEIKKQELQKPMQQAKREVAQPIIKPYTIQVATFKSKELAQEEIEKLKKKGFSARIVLGANGLYEVLVGEYSDSKEASQTLGTLKKGYKDCFIRKR